MAEPQPETRTRGITEVSLKGCLTSSLLTITNGVFATLALRVIQNGADLHNPVDVVVLGATTILHGAQAGFAVANFVKNINAPIRPDGSRHNLGLRLTYAVFQAFPNLLPFLGTLGAVAVDDLISDLGSPPTPPPNISI